MPSDPTKLEKVGDCIDKGIVNEKPFAPVIEFYINGKTIEYLQIGNQKPVHNVEKIQLSSMREQMKVMDKMDAATLGMHDMLTIIKENTVPMCNKLDRTLLAQHQRLPGMPSSFIGLQAHMDMDETIEFEDILNQKDTIPTPELGFNHSVHDVMEKRLNMKF